MFTIRHKDGSQAAQTRSLTREATMMGNDIVQCDISSSSPVDFRIGDRIDFMGQRFVMTVLPAVTRTARDGSRGDALQYKAVTLQSMAVALMQDAAMLDYVLEDNNLHYTSLPVFSFFCADDYPCLRQGKYLQWSEGLQQLADRMTANLRRAYPEDDWQVSIEPGTRISKAGSISVSEDSVWSTLVNAAEQLGFNFTAKTVADGEKVSHLVTIGATVKEIDNEFRYGKELGISKGAGLKAIERGTDENQQIVTRLYAYGSTRNIPYRYYNYLWRGGEDDDLFLYHVPTLEEETLGYVEQDGTRYKRVTSPAMYLPNLMLPMFRNDGEKAYVESENLPEIGIKEATIFFDGSDDQLPDIYPSITGMTTENVYAALTPSERDRQNYKDTEQFPAYDQGALDEVAKSYPVDYDGTIPQESVTAPTFEVDIKNPGFDPNEQIISGETPRISFSSGMMAGRECDIKSIEKNKPANGPTTYRLRCEVTQDTSINQYFPNKDYNITAGDKFTLTGIRMPDVYVAAAEKRLEQAAIEWLAENDHTRYNYRLTIDNIYMARHPEVAAQLMAGVKMRVTDKSLGMDEAITISNLKISAGNAAVWEYEITLADDTEPSLLQRATEAASGQLAATADAISTANTDRIIARLNALAEEYVTKRGYDRAMGPVTFVAGITAGDTTATKLTTVKPGEVTVRDYASTTRQAEIDTQPVDEILTGTLTRQKRNAYASAPLSLDSDATLEITVEIYAENATVDSATATAYAESDPAVTLLSQEITDGDTVSLPVKRGDETYRVTVEALITKESGEEGRIVIGFGSASLTSSTPGTETALRLTPEGIFRMTDGENWVKML